MEVDEQIAEPDVSTNSTNDESNLEEFDELKSNEPATDENEKATKMLNEQELNDLVRYSGLSKENAELLASRLKEKVLLTTNTKDTFYRSIEEPFRKYFSHDVSLVFCNDIESLILEFNSSTYNPDNWRLFLDSSTKSLKAWNVYPCLPVAHSKV